jgi:hypothetical protein
VGDLNAAESEFLLRSIVAEGQQLDLRLPAYLGTDGFLTFAGTYLASDAPDARLSGLNVLRWAPEDATEQINQRLLAVVLTDPDRRVSNRAAEVLCERGQAAWFAGQLKTHRNDPGARKRLVRALGYARNVPRTGRQIVEHLRGGDRRSVTFAAMWQLLDAHKLSLVVVFGLGIGINTIAREGFDLPLSAVSSAGFRIAQTPGPASPVGNVIAGLSAPSQNLAQGVAILLAVGLYALVRTRGDDRPITWRTCVQIALIAVLLSSGLALGRLAFQLFVSILAGSQPEELRFMFADLVSMLAGLMGTMITLSVLVLFLRAPRRAATVPRRALRYAALGYLTVTVWSLLFGLPLAVSMQSFVSRKSIQEVSEPFLTLEFIRSQLVGSALDFLIGTAFLFICLLAFGLAVRRLLGEQSFYTRLLDGAPASDG